MRILVVSNREVNEDASDENVFGEKPNLMGPGEVRLAWAERTNDEWNVTLVDEPAEMDEASVPSRTIFHEFRDELIERNKNCVFYIHGYNKTFKESLDQSWEIQEYYDVAVVSFSWPANPGGFILSEYKKAQGIAEASNIALDRVFEKMGRYFRSVASEDCNISLNFLAHSLGCYLFKSFISSPVFSGETRIFDNIVLQQADVDNPGHEWWVDKLRYAARTYVTINERDAVLAASDVINSDRLGNTTQNLIANRPVYVDFTAAEGVRKKHRLFANARDNPRVENFFMRAFHGERAEAELRYNERKNAFEVD